MSIPASLRPLLLVAVLGVALAPDLAAAQPGRGQPPTFRSPEGPPPPHPKDERGARQRAPEEPPAEQLRRLLRGGVTVPWASVSPCNPSVADRASVRFYEAEVVGCHPTNSATFGGPGEVRLRLEPQGNGLYAINCRTWAMAGSFTMSQPGESHTWTAAGSGSTTHLQTYVNVTSPEDIVLTIDADVPLWDFYGCAIWKL